MSNARFDIDRFVSVLEQAAAEASELTGHRHASVPAILRQLLPIVARMPEAERNEIHRSALVTTLMLRKRLWDETPAHIREALEPAERTH